MADKIIEELWAIKDNIANEYAYNIDALVAHLQAKGLSAGKKVVNLKAILPTGQNKKMKNQREIAKPQAFEQYSKAEK
jgi:hypothetical protein